MAEPYLGEIRMFSGSFAPRNWALCDGQILTINQNNALFALIGTQFGGDGRTSFALPDLRGRVPIHPNSNEGIRQGDNRGAETVRLTVGEMAAHNHGLAANTTVGNKPKALPDVSVLAANDPTDLEKLYTSATKLTQIRNPTTSAGNSLGHENMQPSTVVNFCIALKGDFPQRN